MATIKVSVTAMATLNEEKKLKPKSDDLSGNIVNPAEETTSTTTITTTTYKTLKNDGLVSPVPDVQKDQVSTPKVIRPKIYRVKNSNWYCNKCAIYCNSPQQFEVHMISQKHILEDASSLDNLNFGTNGSNGYQAKSTSFLAPSSICSSSTSLSFEHESDEIDSKIDTKTEPSFHHQNLIASQYKVDATKYLIPESKKKGKFEKFGFYCSKCDSYMTGQIQLVMHVKGAKHNYYSPNEIPDYKPTKVYSPKENLKEKQSKFNSTESDRTFSKTDFAQHYSFDFYKNYFYNSFNSSLGNNSFVSVKPGMRSNKKNGGNSASGGYNKPGYPLEVCFYDNFFKTQEHMQNQNYVPPTLLSVRNNNNQYLSQFPLPYSAPPIVVSKNNQFSSAPLVNSNPGWVTVPANINRNNSFNSFNIHHHHPSQPYQPEFYNNYVQHVPYIHQNGSLMDPTCKIDNTSNSNQLVPNVELKEKQTEVSSPQMYYQQPLPNNMAPNSYMPISPAPYSSQLNELSPYHMQHRQLPKASHIYDSEQNAKLSSGSMVPSSSGNSLTYFYQSSY